MYLSAYVEYMLVGIVDGLEEGLKLRFLSTISSYKAPKPTDSSHAGISHEITDGGQLIRGVLNRNVAWHAILVHWQMLEIWGASESLASGRCRGNSIDYRSLH